MMFDIDFSSFLADKNGTPIVTDITSTRSWQELAGTNVTRRNQATGEDEITDCIVYVGY